MSASDWWSGVTWLNATIWLADVSSCVYWTSPAWWSIHDYNIETVFLITHHYHDRLTKRLDRDLDNLTSAFKQTNKSLLLYHNLNHWLNVKRWLILIPVILYFSSPDLPLMLIQVSVCIHKLQHLMTHFSARLHNHLERSEQHWPALIPLLSSPGHPGVDNTSWSDLSSTFLTTLSCTHLALPPDHILSPRPRYPPEPSNQKWELLCINQSESSIIMFSPGPASAAPH